MEALVGYADYLDDVRSDLPILDEIEEFGVRTRGLSAAYRCRICGKADAVEHGGLCLECEQEGRH
jgi:hypothetical protein